MDPQTVQFFKAFQVAIHEGTAQIKELCARLDKLEGRFNEHTSIEYVPHSAGIRVEEMAAVAIMKATAALEAAERIHEAAFGVVENT